MLNPHLRAEHSTAFHHLRLRPLDGLRGVAIALVMGFHYFYVFSIERPDLYPFGGAFQNFIIFKYGYLGVELFFIVSGFVIAMTLESCATPSEFAAKRLARLCPPLLFCSILTFCIVSISVTPFALSSHQAIINFVPSLTFIEPRLWQWLFPGVRFVDYAYWSLAVEAKFYIIAACLFFFVTKCAFRTRLAVFTIAAIAIRALSKRVFPEAEPFLSLMLIPDYLPWLFAGVVFYDLNLGMLRKPAAALMLVPCLAYSARTDFHVIVFGLLFMGAFWAVCTKQWPSLALSIAPLVWLGECSYSVYLLHFEIGMTAISAIPKELPTSVQVMLVACVSIAIIAAGRLLYHLIEMRAKRWVLQRILPRHSRPARPG